jgi:hypothetical protein
MSDRSAIGAPDLKVINSDATDEEIAAITAVFAAMGGATTRPKKPTSVWAANSRKMRPAIRRGPGAWRASGLPH